MRAVVVPVFLFCVAFFSPRASASVASFATTDQSITFTGLGGNAQGEGQSRSKLRFVSQETEDEARHKRSRFEQHQSACDDGGRQKAILAVGKIDEDRREREHHQWPQ